MPHRLFKVEIVFKRPHSIWPSLLTSRNCTCNYTCTSTYANVYTFIISLSRLTILSLILVQWTNVDLNISLTYNRLGCLRVCNVTAVTAVSPVSF